MSTRPIWSSSSTSGLGSSGHQTTTSSSSTISPSNNPQEWCLHAQLTIRHPSATGKMIVKPSTAILKTDDLSPPIGSGERPTRNLHFECSWENSGESIVTEVVPIESGIQKFESWLQAQPLKGSSTPVSNIELDSPCSAATNSIRFPVEAADNVTIKNPQFSSLLKPKVIPTYGRRCKSTCSITLTSNTLNNAATVSFENRCGSVEAERASSLPPVKPILKDAETQTINNRDSQPKIVQKLLPTSSPSATGTCSNGGLLMMGGSPPPPPTASSKVRNTNKDIISLPDTENIKCAKQLKNRVSGSTVDRLSRKSSRSTSQCRAKSSPPVHQLQKNNQPRTIHIDVYCTGSDVSTNTEDTSASSDESTSTSQTTVRSIFHSPQYKISHHCKKKQMPVCFTSNVTDLVNLATNQIKLQQQQHHHRQDKERTVPGATGNKHSSTPLNSTSAKVAVDHATPKVLKHPVSQGLPFVGDFFDKKTIFLGRNTSYDDSMSTSYPSSMAISRNTTATSFSSDWTQVDLNERHRREEEEMENVLKQDEVSHSGQEFLFSSKSRSSDSISMAKSYAYSLDSLEGSSSEIADHKSDNSHLKHSFPNSQHNEQWWMDYILKKFNLKDNDNPASDPSKVIGRKETTNLLRMKRLSIPNYDLDGISMEDMMLPPFMPTTSLNDPVDSSETLLETATKFGKVVKGFKKPGHHITGPAKNPNCPCSHCRFHFEEKEENNAMNNNNNC